MDAQRETKKLLTAAQSETNHGCWGRSSGYSAENKNVTTKDLKTYFDMCMLSLISADI